MRISILTVLITVDSFACASRSLATPRLLFRSPARIRSRKRVGSGVRNGAGAGWGNGGGPPVVVIV